ncbi:MAG: helix-turn-helix transcriptional regulator [Acutalibacteraceae bacterium]|nr:helix-turn-helix transcriptional regulator [Acutalibacteraceae bacterium]
MHTDVREYINLCRVKKGNMSEAELARRTGQTPQNMNNKYKRNTFKVSELEKVAEALGAELKIQFIDTNTNEPII